MRIVKLHDLPCVAASHENPSAPGVVKRVLFARTELPAGRVQMVNWATMAPGQEFREHYHEDMDEIFLIIEGTAHMRCGGAEAMLQAGDAVLVVERETHTMRNVGEVPLQYFVFGVTRDSGGKTVLV